MFRPGPFVHESEWRLDCASSLISRRPAIRVVIRSNRKHPVTEPISLRNLELTFGRVESFPGKGVFQEKEVAAACCTTTILSLLVIPSRYWAKREVVWSAFQLWAARVVETVSTGPKISTDFSQIYWSEVSAPLDASFLFHLPIQLGIRSSLLRLAHRPPQRYWIEKWNCRRFGWRLTLSGKYKHC